MTSLREVQLTDKDMEDHRTWHEKLLNITEHSEKVTKVTDGAMRDGWVSQDVKGELWQN